MRGKRIRLRVWRVDRELTQSQLARRAGLNVTRYWQIENGEGLPPTKDEKAAIAKALSVSLPAIAWPDHQLTAQAS
jgi:transcriptional regulator with XRE-family HTH domain